MRYLLDRYVRSLKEREDDPERYQDLGTLVCWILEQRRYVIVQHAYKHERAQRQVSKGRLQLGVDILAYKRLGRRKFKSYRFVLKKGKIGKAEWTPDTDGSMPHDLWLAAEVGTERERGYGFEPSKVVVAAVHNGDRDDAAIGTLVQNALRRMRRRNHCRTMWWDATRLVIKILEAVPGGDALSFAQHPDASIFPPLVRPFIRMALDSLHPQRARVGGAFDVKAIDMLLDARLPRDLIPSDKPSGDPARLHRALTELSLIAHMVQVECDRVAEGTTLPVFDTLERVLCRAVHLVGRLPDTPGKELRSDLDVLIDQYVGAARRLLERLAPVRDLPFGLAVPTKGEAINYPLRTLRLTGHLALAALALHFRAEREEARRIADGIDELWQHNLGGCLSPVTDDQLIDLGLVWELWLRLGMREAVAHSASELITRLALRKAANLPLPGLWQRARWPMDPDHLQALVEAHARGREIAPSAFNDRGSTILPLAAYLAQRLGQPPEPVTLEVFWPARSGGPRVPSTVQAGPESTGGEDIWTVYSQCWQPPEDAAEEWYAMGIEHRGTCNVVDVTAPADEFQRKFEEINQPIAESAAERAGISIVDRIAWKVWRTPPPLALFIGLVRAA